MSCALKELLPGLLFLEKVNPEAKVVGLDKKVTVSIGGLSEDTLKKLREFGWEPYEDDPKAAYELYTGH